MIDIKRTVIFKKLNMTGYQSLEAATLFCKMKNNQYVELSHWIFQLLQNQRNDLSLLLNHFGVNSSRLAKDITTRLEKLPKGSDSITDFSSHIDEVIEQAWLYSSLKYNSHKIRTFHILIALLSTKNLKLILNDISDEFKKVSLEQLDDNYRTILNNSEEQQDTSIDEVQASQQESERELGAADDFLSKYTTDLTQEARDQKMDPIVGRDIEIRQIIDILLRRRQNNPLLLGEAGVGKTAVVEGLAQRIVKGDVPGLLGTCKLLTLDIGLLMAGAGVKGEFENRLKGIISQIHTSKIPIILFIDEVHTIMGAGGKEGTGDVANLIKPALARGDLKTIAATTWGEYKKHIEKDPALTRRFQTIEIKEPDQISAINMVRAMVNSLENHHKVSILDEAIVEAVKLSSRYIPARQLPDKAISLIDTAAARVAVSQSSEPSELVDIKNQILFCENEVALYQRDENLGREVLLDIATKQQEIDDLKKQSEAISGRWQTQKSAFEEVIDIRKSKPEEIDRDLLKEKIKALQPQQGDNLSVSIDVDAPLIATIVQDWTGIPVSKMQRDAVESMLNIAKTLGQRIIGQQHAIDIISQKLKISRAKLDNPNKPVGVFMLAGSSGVGKTETAIALADVLYGGEQNLITINMSEFQEPHTVSTLKGSPPGYVGYGEGGVLTEAVKRNPYSVVLLDEIEKAHPDVHELFFQVFDKGMMEDGEGRKINFKNTLILLTTNVGTETLMDLYQKGIQQYAMDEITSMMKQPLMKVFPPAFLGRCTVIPYYPLDDDAMSKIIDIQLNKIKNRVLDKYRAELEYGDDLKKYIIDRCREVESGGRIIEAIITKVLLSRISELFLQSMIDQNNIDRLSIQVVDNNLEFHTDG